jgi:hypothetical protein
VFVEQVHEPMVPLLWKETCAEFHEHYVFEFHGT